mgnify:CR=1 FL=1
MSVTPRAGNGKITVPDIVSRKSHVPGSTPQKITCLTAYDYPTARLLDEAGVARPLAHVLGDVDQHRAGPARSRDVECLAHDARDVGGVAHPITITLIAIPNPPLLNIALMSFPILFSVPLRLSVVYLSVMAHPRSE